MLTILYDIWSGFLSECSKNILVKNNLYFILLTGLTGLTAAATVDSKNDPCTNGYSFFTNLNYYRSWMKCNMRGPMATCALDLPNVRRHYFTIFSSPPT